jgi:hypothetical protein
MPENFAILLPCVADTMQGQETVVLIADVVGGSLFQCSLKEDSEHAVGK